MINIVFTICYFGDFILTLLLHREHGLIRFPSESVGVGGFLVYLTRWRLQKLPFLVFYFPYLYTEILASSIQSARLLLPWKCIYNIRKWVDFTYQFTRYHIWNLTYHRLQHNNSSVIERVLLWNYRETHQIFQNHIRKTVVWVMRPWHWFFLFFCPYHGLVEGVGFTHLGAILDMSIGGHMVQNRDNQDHDITKRSTMARHFINVQVKLIRR